MAKEFMQNDDGFFVIENGKIVASGAKARRQYDAFIADEKQKIADRASKQSAAELLASLLPPAALEALVDKLKTEQNVEGN